MCMYVCMYVFLSLIWPKKDGGLGGGGIILSYARNIFKIVPGRALFVMVFCECQQNIYKILLNPDNRDVIADFVSGMVMIYII